MAEKFELTERDIPQDAPEVRTSTGNVITLVGTQSADVQCRRIISSGDPGNYVAQPDDPCLYYTAQPEKKERY